MKKLIGILSVVFLMIPFGTTFAQEHSGGDGLIYVHSAKAIGKGYLNTYFNSRFFGKLGGAGLRVATYWDVQGAFAINYGLTDRLELQLLPVLYQDTNRGGTGYNIPDDFFLKLKIGSLGDPESPFRFGIIASTRIPTGKTHNIIYEPYSAGTIEAGFTGLMSYFKDVGYPEDNYSFHANLGYIFHNDAGNKLTDSPNDTVSAKSISTELTYGFGLRYPFDKWDITFEFNGNAFLQKPPVTAFSRENYFYFTPGVRYKVLRWLNIDFAADLRMTPDKDETKYEFGIGRLPMQLPSTWPDWRINLAVQVFILPVSLRQESERDILMKKAASRRELFEQIVRQQKETEAAEKELERIKKERRKAEKELQNLRELLEGKKKKTEPQKQKPKP
ncbi:hypothetical protein BMS3Bbin03_00404 [bacterium BMS3Bbin03]|nr:hypothetical protein BMS3Bbin03_00404 [bacterium BMS3Bbin03]